MSISPIASSLISYLDPVSSLSSVSKSASRSSSAAITDTFTSSLSRLESAIQSGNVSSAQTCLTQLEQSNPGASSSGGAVGTFLSSVEKALSIGDISAAQSALKTLETSLAAGMHLGERHRHQGGGVSKDLSDLISSIQSGDLTSAQSLLNSIQNQMLQMGSASSSDPQGSDPLGALPGSMQAALSQAV